MCSQPILNIMAEWDEEAQVWVATSDDVPGLITEAASYGALLKRLQVLIPELMELNCGLTTGQAFRFRVISEGLTVADAA